MTVHILTLTERTVVSEEHRAQLSERDGIYTLDSEGETIRFGADTARWLRDALAALLA